MESRLKTRNILVAVFLFFIHSIVTNNITIIKGAEEMKSVWESFDKWYEWKKTTDLTKEQKTVVDYFEKAGEIKDKARDHHLNSMPSEKSVEIVKEYVNDLKNLTSPKECLPYHNALMTELEMQLEYQEGREASLSDDELQKITLKKLSVDGLQFTGFFQAIKEIGLFDNAEEEMTRLGIEKPKEGETKKE